MSSLNCPNVKAMWRSPTWSQHTEKLSTHALGFIHFWALTSLLGNKTKCIWIKFQLTRKDSLVLVQGWMLENPRSSHHRPLLHSGNKHLIIGLAVSPACSGKLWPILFSLCSTCSVHARACVRQCIDARPYITCFTQHFTQHFIHYYHYAQQTRIESKYPINGWIDFEISFTSSQRALAPSCADTVTHSTCTRIAQWVQHKQCWSGYVAFEHRHALGVMIDCWIT